MKEGRRTKDAKRHGEDHRRTLLRSPLPGDHRRRRDTMRCDVSNFLAIAETSSQQRDEKLCLHREGSREPRLDAHATCESPIDERAIVSPSLGTCLAHFRFDWTVKFDLTLDDLAVTGERAITRGEDRFWTVGFFGQQLRPPQGINFRTRLWPLYARRFHQQMHSMYNNGRSFFPPFSSQLYFSNVKRYLR